MAASTLPLPFTAATPAVAPPVSPREGPPDPARVSPIHLPALAHVAADLDGLDVPVRIVAAPEGPADELGVCVDCATAIHADAPVWDAIAVVRAIDPCGHEIRDEVCAIHLSDLVSSHRRRGRLVVVDVPAREGRKWFERSARETFYPVSEHDCLTGVAVVRGIFDAWRIVDVVDGFAASRHLCPVGLRGDGESFDDCRLRAEVLAQAVASVRAADAYQAASAAVAETGAAA